MLNKLSTIRDRGISEEGFTLIELIIVVVILGILTAIAIPIFLNQQKAALASGVKADVRNTNTNIAAKMIREPAAQQIGTSPSADATPTAGTIQQGDTIQVGVSTNRANATISDKGTRLKVTGAWDRYVIVGTNTGLAAGSAYIYDSFEGTYVGTVDLQ